MINSFEFSFFVPTPDTTANCALSRWNDSSNNLSEFLKRYINSSQSLKFGFSRYLNALELIHLSKENVFSQNEKYDYVLNYKKYGFLNAFVCGFNIPLINPDNPFLETTWCYNDTYTEEFDSSLQYITHVFNHTDSNLSQTERITATINAITNLKSDVENKMTDNEISCYFEKNVDGTSQTKQSVINTLESALNIIDSMNQQTKDFVFGFDNKKDLEESITTTIPNQPFEFTLENSTKEFYDDFLYTSEIYQNNNIANFRLNLNLKEYDYVLENYFYPNGIKPVINRGTKLLTTNGLNKKHLLVYFKFSLTETPALVPFQSHDGTTVPLSKQTINISYSKFSSEDEVVIDDLVFPKMWDDENECPIYFDENGNKQLMIVDSNINGMGGCDYTIWTSPAQKTENGFQFLCCLPLAFYNDITDCYSNEYYAKKQHENVSVGQVLYRVPVVKQLYQNIEEAIVNTHLAKCLNNIQSADNSNCENDDTVVLGGVVVDEFTKNTYYVDNDITIASKSEYGCVKITNSNEDYLIDALDEYSKTGNTDYKTSSMTSAYHIPTTGQSVDVIALYDIMKHFCGGSVGYHCLIKNGENDDDNSIISLGSFTITSDGMLQLNSNADAEINITDALYINTHSFDISSKNLFLKSHKSIISSECLISNTGVVDESQKQISIILNSDNNPYFYVTATYQNSDSNLETAVVCFEYSTNVSSDRLPCFAFTTSGDGHCDLGTTSNKWRDIHCERLYGILKSAAENNIGAIANIEIILSPNAVPPTSLTRGDVIKNSSTPGSALYKIRLDGVDEDSTHSWIILNSVTLNSYNSYYVLAIRVE